MLVIIVLDLNLKCVCITYNFLSFIFGLCKFIALPMRYFNFTSMCRCLIVLEDSSACILRLSSLVWHQCTWPSYDSWVTRMRQRNSVIVWKLVQMVVSSYGKEFRGASVIVIRKFATVRMASLFRGIWLSTFPVGIGKS